MSIRQQAEIEMKAAGFSEEDIETMDSILATFFEQWDSGGAVSVMIPVLDKLLRGKPLRPLTGEDDEWMEIGEEHGMGKGTLYQNKRCSTVFKSKTENGDWCYDIDSPDVDGKRVRITFPYAVG